MRTSKVMAVLAVLLCSMTLLRGSAAVPRQETQSYTAAGGDLLTDCDVPGVNIGGGCFLLDGTEQSVNIAINDDNFEAVGGSYQFTDAGGNALDSNFFCSWIDGVTVPAGATNLYVFVQQATSPTALLGCANQSAGTTGTVTASYS